MNQIPTAPTDLPFPPSGSRTLALRPSRVFGLRAGRDKSTSNPNPFNSTTELKYTLPFTADVSISVFDVNGRLVADVLRQRQGPGSHSALWNGSNDSGSPVSSGLYLCQFNAVGESGAQYRSVLRMAFVK